MLALALGSLAFSAPLTVAPSRSGTVTMMGPKGRFWDRPDSTLNNGKGTADGVAWKKELAPSKQLKDPTGRFWEKGRAPQKKQYAPFGPTNEEVFGYLVPANWGVNEGGYDPALAPAKD